MDASIHSALWLTYLRRRYRQLPEDDIVDVLAKSRDAIQAPLLAIALCNLLQAYPSDDATPQLYKTLFKKVLGLESSQARQMYSDQDPPIFPLNPNQVVTEPVLKISDDLSTTTVSLALCRQRTLDQCDKIDKIVDPSTWSRSGLFWRNVAPLTDGTVDGELHLPDQDITNPVPNIIPVRLSVETSRGPFELRLDYEMTKNIWIEVCRGYLSVTKEPGRPGVTRTTQQRTIRFTPGQFNEWRLMTTLYWIQTEIVSAVFPSPPSQAMPRSPAQRRRP